jgi:hypothetical protein
MAGTIIADKIQTENSFLTLNVGQTLVATINSSGILNSSGGTMIGANGSVSNTAIAGFIRGTQLAANTVTGDKLGQSAVSSNNITSSITLTTPTLSTPVLTTPTLSGNVNSSSNSTIRFVSTNAYNGQQNSKIQWINENQNGVMAQISGIRETNSGAPGALAFYTSSNVDSGGYTPTERLRVISDGAVRIACEDYSASPSSTNYGVALFNTSQGSRFFGQGTGTETQIEFGNRNGTRGSIQTTSGGTSYNTTSDYRLKQNITPMTGALAKVTQLKPSNYKWKVDGSNGQGFIAHELQSVIPECVTGEKDAVDDDGNPKYQMVDTSFLVATLTAAIQEQQAIIDDLKARIEALEA